MLILLGECWGHPNRYVGVFITNDMSFNAMIVLITANELQILEFYWSTKHKVGNSLNLKLTRVSSYS